MDFTNLTTEGTASFILAIVFSIFAIAGFMIMLNSKREANIASKIVFSIIMPGLAIFCWSYMLFCVFGVFANQGTSFYISFLVAVAFYVVILLVYAIVRVVSKKKTVTNTTAEVKEANN